MANFTLSPNMNLVIPTPGEDPGPNYASNNSNSLMIVDGHNHSAGYGVPIGPNGMNINADLPVNNNNLTLIKTLNFTSQPSSLAGAAPNLGCVYVAGNELYYNDEAGNVVQVTNNGSVNAGAGSITGLPSGTASATYSGGTFVWQSATSTSANLDAGSIILRNNTASSKGLTFSPPNSMAADYSITLPTLPLTTNFVTMDTSGNLGSSWTPDNATLVVNSSVVQVGVIQNSNIATGVITNSKLAPVNFNFSGTTGTLSLAPVSTLTLIPQLSTTLTTVGRPTISQLQQHFSDPSASITSAGDIVIAFARDSIIISSYIIQGGNWPVSMFQGYDYTTVAAGAHTYDVYYIATAGAQINFTIQIVTEL